MWSQSGTANNRTISLPYAFTEEDVAMLSTILRTDVAEEISIAIMDAFVSIKKQFITLEQVLIMQEVKRSH